MANRRWYAALAWAAVVALLAAWLAVRLATGPTLNPSLTALLPTAERDPVVAAAAGRVRDAFERTVVFVIAAPDAASARAAATYAYDELRQTGEFADLRLRLSEEDLRITASLYFAHRSQLLTREARRQLMDGDEVGFERGVLGRYFGPVTTVNSALIEQDPLLLLPAFLAERLSDSAQRFQPRQEMLTLSEDSRAYVLFSGLLAETPFSFALQRRLMPVLKSVRGALPVRFSGAELLVAGVLPHAAKGTMSAEAEMSLNGILSIIGVTALFWIVFRSGRCLLLMLISIVTGCFVGFVCCLAIFGEVYLLTLVFGTSFVGIAVDYSFLYFSERLRLGTGWTPQLAIDDVFAGMTLGLVTTLIGFAGLLLAPFPGLQQMATFSIAGLTASYLCVLAWNPVLMPRPAPGSDGSRWLAAAAAFVRLSRGSVEKRLMVVLPIIAAVGLVGLFRLVPEDDVRLLQTLDPAVVAEENRVGALTGQQVASQFFLVEGRDPADLLAREERLVDRLRQAQREGHLLGHLALSDFVPSPARQAENRALLAPLITPADGLLRRIGERVGLPAATEDAYAQAFARQTAPLELKEWLSHAAVQTQARLWLGETGRGVASVVALQGLSDLDAVRALTDADDKVHFVDFVGDLSDLFGRLRYEATWLTIASYGLVSALTILRYGWRGGLKVMIPSLFAAFVTLAALGLAGEPLTLFSVMALLLVLGIGVDYGLFLRETKGDAEPTVLAVALAAVSTILAFGLLAFSATAAIRAFGLTVFTGISVGFALSPLCLRATGSPGPAGQALDGRRGVRAPR